MVIQRAVEWSKAPRVMLVMLLLNVLWIGTTLWWWHELRTERQAEAAAEAQIEAQVQAWLSMQLYAPAKLTVDLGDSPQTTRVVEEPLFDGVRVLETFPGRWVTKLRHIEADALICTMPQTGPRTALYSEEGTATIAGTWNFYTGDDGTCFARMKRGEMYELITVREAFKTIDGRTYQRFLDPLRSAPFIP